MLAPKINGSRQFTETMPTHNQYGYVIE